MTDRRFSEICTTNNVGAPAVKDYIQPLADSYLRICEAKKPEERDHTEFFGLRDFYRFDDTRTALPAIRL